MMWNYMMGWGGSWMMFFSSISWILIFILLVLAIVWLWQQVNKK